MIDTAPTFGMRITAALIAGNFVLSPIELEGYSIDGITSMIKVFQGIKQKFNLRFKFLGMLPNRYNAVSPAQKLALKEPLPKCASYIVPAKIPMHPAISEALNLGVPVWRLDKSSARDAGKEFKSVLDIFIQRSESQ